ncbi:MAG: hypothetical protein M3R00_02030, partial [Pseudomonadota bacterium]|nr:hypothetical protein [Pseudomonadota bacterium]
MKKIDFTFMQDKNTTLSQLRAGITPVAVKAPITLLWHASFTRDGDSTVDSFSLLAISIYMSRHEMTEYLLGLGENSNSVSSKHRFPSLLLAKDDRMYELLIRCKVDYLYALQLAFQEILDSQIRPYLIISLIRLLTFLHKHFGSTPEINAVIFKNAHIMNELNHAQLN